MVNYLIVLMSVVLLALQFTATKLYQLKFGSSPLSSARFNVIVRSVTSVIFLAATLIALRGLQFSGFSLLCAAVTAAACVMYTMLGFVAMRFGPVSVFTMFLMCGGMLLPYLFGVIFLNETINTARVVGMALMLISLAMPLLDTRSEGAEKKKTPAVYWLLCAVIFVLNGFVSIFSKVHQITPTGTVDTIEFVFLGNLCNFVISLIVYLIFRARAKPEPEPHADASEDHGRLAASLKSTVPVMIAVCAFTAVFDGVSYFLQLIGAKNLDASVLYPMITGGSIVLSAVAAFIFFKEKPKKFAFIGLIISFAATFLFLAA
ncbi:MAG: hypothetical protein K6D94_02305 [Clostridiales bacterium]|nr:hypothetical protein [Clostridiales bacterium]